MGQVIVFAAVSRLCGEGRHLWCGGGTGATGKGRKLCQCECHGGRPLMGEGGGRPANPQARSTSPSSPGEPEHREAGATS